MSPRRSWVLALAAVGAAGTGAATGLHGQALPTAVHRAVANTPATEDTPATTGLDQQLKALKAQESELQAAVATEESQPPATLPASAAPLPTPAASSGTAPAPAPPPPVHATTGASGASPSGTVSDDGSDDDRPSSSTGSHEPGDD